MSLYQVAITKEEKKIAEKKFDELFKKASDFTKLAQAIDLYLRWLGR